MPSAYEQAKTFVEKGQTDRAIGVLQTAAREKKLDAEGKALLEELAGGKAEMSEPQPEVQRWRLVKLSKPFYLGSIVVGMGLFAVIMLVTDVVMVLGVGGAGMPSADVLVGIFITFGVSALVGLLGLIVFFVLTYRMWAAIQDGHARTTPGKAVGYQFIPFYNLYWVFQAYWGFAKAPPDGGVRPNSAAPRLVTLFTCIGPPDRTYARSHLPLT